MGFLNIYHPDIEEFIYAKADGKSLANFNLSVGIHDSFMQALEQDLDWPLRHPTTGLPVKTVITTFLWDFIAD
jgi:ribonucleoside-diphosphate reductase alpha chain